MSIVDGADELDPLHMVSEPHHHWARSNLGEAMPGVLTPLSWSLWSVAAERGARESAYRVGAIPGRERQMPEAAGRRIIRIFYGRPAMLVEHMAMIGDRMPGTTGPEIVKSIFGRVPDDMRFTPTRRRYPFVALRFPLSFATIPRQLRETARDYQTWWEAAISRVDCLDLNEATALFAEARERFGRAVPLQSVSFVCLIQPLFGAVARLSAKIGSDNSERLKGAYGNAEMDLPIDLWHASRGKITVAELVRRHGYHGPHEGELSSTVWREDDASLRKLVEQYAARMDSQDPERRDAVNRSEITDAENAAIANVPKLQRPATRTLLWLARTRLPLRGVSKQAFLQAFDVARASARRIGDHLVKQRVLDEVDDVFYLTAQELTGSLPDNAREVVRFRASRRAEYQLVSIPEAWTGMPESVAATATSANEDCDVISGTGVSAGVVDGTVRVVLGPDFTDVEPDEILVAPTTDPSWASIMFISAALVVDIGGPLSHAAVVARELGIPCVVNTRSGTRQLHTGDRVRVDGRVGTIEVLERTAR
jgi:pyruvate,water dikinase